LAKSLKNLAVATFVGLVVSAFTLHQSFKEVQPELLSRTSLILYDILIFSGLVGAV
jgi:hypothetical protein